MPKTPRELASLLDVLAHPTEKQVLPVIIEKGLVV
jgi:hypothetical protein